MYPFGIDGTLGWASPAGELLQVASCIENRLVGVDYKKSLDRGEDYYSRGKVLEKATDSSQGSGYGIGLSLDLDGLREPYEVFWILNRWPRFSYHRGDIEIRLQYYVEAGSVIQQYQIRNDGQEEEILPYIVSSDVCFREHGAGKHTFYPVPIHKSVQRLLLLKNSEVWIRDTIENVQMKMAVFLNAHRQSLWSDPSPIRKAEGEDNVAKLEDPSQNLSLSIRAKFQEAISSGKLWSEHQENDNRFRFAGCYPEQGTPIHKEPNYAEYRSTLVIPAKSTQELCVIIQISELLKTGSVIHDQTRNPDRIQISSNVPTARRLIDQTPQRRFQKIRHSQASVVAKLRQFLLKSSGPKYWTQASEIVSRYLHVGKACVSMTWIGEARYYFFMASLVADNFYTNDTSSQIKVLLEYANFLKTHG